MQDYTILYTLYYILTNNVAVKHFESINNVLGERGGKGWDWNSWTVDFNAYPADVENRVSS